MSKFFTNKLVKFLFITGSAFTIAIFLFYFMSSLIAQTPNLKKSNQASGVIEFIRTKPKSFLDEKKRKLPKKKFKDKPPKMMPHTSDTPKVPHQLNVSNLDLKLALKGHGPAMGNLTGKGHSGGAPLVRINPEYPRKARMLGIEGWVILQFTITEMGTVVNIKVIDSRPKDMFEQAAVQAVSRWKYQALVENGEAMRQDNIQVQLDFKLEKE